MRLYRNLPLFWKMLLPFLAVILIAAAGASLAVYVQWKEQDKHLRIYERGSDIILRLENLNRNLSQFYLLVLQHVSTESAQEMERKESEVWRVSDQIVEDINSLKLIDYPALTLLPDVTSENDDSSTSDIALSNRYQQISSDIDSLLRMGKSHRGVINAVIMLSADFEKEAAYRMLRSTGEQFLVGMLDISSRLLKEHIAELDENMEVAVLRTQQSIFTSLTVLGGSGLMILLIVLLLATSVTRKIGTVVAWSKLIGDGDFTARVEYDAKDELGDLARAMNMMALRTRRMIDIVEANNAMVENQRAELEKTVEQRTHKLNEINTQLQLELLEKEQRQQQLLHAKEAAEQASRAKSMFLASMSHELRTPLNAILGFAQLFAYDDNLDEKQLENLDEIQSAGTHLLDLINDLLDLAKIEAGRVELTMESIAPRALLSECISLTQPTAEKYNVTLHLDCTDEDTNVNTDYVRLKQVVLNLLSNAVKYNQKYGRVEVRYELIYKNRFRITVEDTGKGIPLERQHELFESFSRLGAENSSIEGTGIGLVIIKRLVEQMGGQIDFESNPGEGSRFWVEFDKSISEHVLVEDKKPIQSMETLGQKCTILYIEDNPSNQKLMRQLVSNRLTECELVMCEDAETGLEYALEYMPELIYMDIHLPGMDGYEALQRLREKAETRDIPVIAVSASAPDQSLHFGNGGGFDGHIVKPIDIDKLLELTRACLQGREALA